MKEKIFLGIGVGPIQTGIFVAGTATNYDRIVLADVDEKLVSAIKATGSITVNIASKTNIKSEVYENIEIYNPNDPEDLNILIDLASRAFIISVALPSTHFYNYCIPWLKRAFKTRPHARRYIYTAENSTSAASEFGCLLGNFPETYILDTVIGKMSKVFSKNESTLPLIAPGINRGHLFEEFDTIYTSNANDIDEVNIKCLIPKDDLYPFEEAKLFGHNAAHLILGLMAMEKDCKYMSDTVNYPAIIELTKKCLIDECGAFLCKKHHGKDDFFLMNNFSIWADELIERMISPVLRDSVCRIVRNLDIKMSWNDRFIGTIRRCMEQHVKPHILSSITRKVAGHLDFKKITDKWPDNQEAIDIKKLLE